MTQKLTALAENVSSIPSTHVKWLTTACNCGSHGSDPIHVVSTGHGHGYLVIISACSIHMYTELKKLI